MEKKVVRVLVDATTGPTVSIGQKVKRGQVVGRFPDGSSVTSPVSGIVKACTFDADKHLLCLFIEKESPPGTNSS